MSKYLVLGFSIIYHFLCLVRAAQYKRKLRLLIEMWYSRNDEWINEAAIIIMEVYILLFGLKHKNKIQYKLFFKLHCPYMVVLALHLETGKILSVVHINILVRCEWFSPFCMYFLWRISCRFNISKIMWIAVWPSSSVAQYGLFEYPRYG